MARPKASDARDTRAEILSAALDLFAERGFHGTSLRDIARAVGIREGAVYHHFESKDALFEAVLSEGEREAAARCEELVAAVDEHALPESLERLTIALLERFSMMRERKAFRALMNDGVRLATQGRGDYWARAGALREPLERLMTRLLGRARLLGDTGALLAFLFVTPLLAWRQLQILSPEHPFVGDHRGFARRHVEQFLLGAMPVMRPPRKLNVRSIRKAASRS